MTLLRMLVPPALLLLAGCAADVYHPTKSDAEMRADVGACTDEANRRYWMDPVAALYNAYDCLEAMGYQRNRRDFAAKVERALGEAPRRREEERRRSEAPCKVPCR